MTTAADHFAHDLFIVYAAADESFVQGFLLAKLDVPSDRVLRIQALGLGEMIAKEIERSIRSSRVTIVVLSFAYLTDPWAVFGAEVAACATVCKAVDGVLIPLVREECELTAHLRSLVRLDFRDQVRDRWEIELARLQAYLDRPAAPDIDLPCPYPGMRPFTESDAGRFFGRDDELDRIVRLLRRGKRELFVIGASGSGKSSLIAAGLVPRLACGTEGLPCFHVQIFRPGEQPMERLAAALGGIVTALDVAVGSLLTAHAPATALLLVIDQLEELFSVASAEQREAFLAAIRRLRNEPRCVLVFALRADFYDSLLESALWTDSKGRILRIEIGPLGTERMRAVIERPAHTHQVYLQPELVSRLVDAAREPGSLPLLQETLRQLWRKRRQRLLALADYVAFGDAAGTGLEFAIREHADAVLATLTSAQEMIALRILLRLVNFGEGRADTRRQQSRAALCTEGESGGEFRAVLDCLVNNRLLTITGDDQHGDIRVDLAHEILVQAWPKLAAWIASWRVLEQRRRELEVVAAGWRTRRGGGLLDAVALAEAVAWRDRAATMLGQTPTLAEFLEASAAAQRAASRRRTLVSVLVLIGGAVAVVLIVGLKVEANHEHETAERHGSESRRLREESQQYYQEAGRQELIESERPQQALRHLIAAWEAAEKCGASPSASLRMLLAEATRNPPVSPPLEHDGTVLAAAFSPDGTRIVTASSDGTARVWRTANGAPLSPPLRHAKPVVTAEFSHDGTRVVTASDDGTARVWDAISGQALSTPFVHQGLVRGAWFSPDGTRVVTASSDKTARVWSVATGRPLFAPLQHGGSVVKAAFSADGARIVTASADATARVWDAGNGKQLTRPLEHENFVAGVAFCPVGDRIATASWDGTARIWDAATGKLLLRLRHEDTVWDVAFSADGAQVVTASEDGTARVWNATTGRPLSPPLKHRDAVLGAAFSADGTRVVTASRDKTARIWDIVTGDPLSLPLEHRAAVQRAGFSADGTRVITASDDMTARVWDADITSSLPRVLRHQDAVVSAAFNSDGTRIVTASWDATARTWETATGKPLAPSVPHEGRVVSAAFSVQGTQVATASWDSTARLWDAATGGLILKFEHQRPLASAAISADGTRLVTASEDMTACVWDLGTGHRLSPLLRHAGPVVMAAFSPDGNRVVTASHDRTARVWDAETGEPVSRPLEHHDVVLWVAFSPDGTRVITACQDGAARVWDTSTGALLLPPLRHRGAVRSAAFSPDGARIVTASDDRTARVWNATTGVALPAMEHQGAVRSAAFSPDGARIVTASDDRTARVWDAVNGKPLSSPLQHRDVVWIAAFSPDGTRIVTASGDKTARVWDLPLALGTLAEWRARTERFALYVLTSGALQPDPRRESRPERFDGQD